MNTVTHSWVILCFVVHILRSDGSISERTKYNSVIKNAGNSPPPPDLRPEMVKSFVNIQFSSLMLKHVKLPYSLTKIRMVLKKAIK